MSYSYFKKIPVPFHHFCISRNMDVIVDMEGENKYSAYFYGLVEIWDDKFRTSVRGFGPTSEEAVKDLCSKVSGKILKKQVGYCGDEETIHVPELFM